MPPLDERMPARIADAAASVIASHHLPGISIGVVRDDELIFAEGFGFADIESREPMTPAHGQRIASITKTMVGLCAMAAVDDGRLQLEGRVVDLLPELRLDGPASAMTVWHLLTHTSGIGEAPTLERLRDVANPDRDAAQPPGDFTTLYPDGVIVECEPGSKWAYCNNGYALLGEIVARAEREPLDAIMRRRIFGPLGMRDTHIDDTPHARLSTGYHRAPNEDTRFQLERAGISVREEPTVDGHNIRGKFSSDFNRAMRAAGGVQSTIPDMARYAAALLRRGAGIVRPDTCDAMIAPAYCPHPGLINWGLSFARHPYRARTTFGHGGAYFGGWNSNLSVSPADGAAIVQHMNVMLDRPAAVFERIQRAVFDEPEPAIERHAPDPKILATAAGEYRLPMPGPLTNFRPATRLGPIVITRAGESLALRSRWGDFKSPAELVACDAGDPTMFAVARPDGTHLDMAFALDQSGAVAGLRCDDLVYMPRFGPA